MSWEAQVYALQVLDLSSSGQTGEDISVAIRSGQASELSDTEREDVSPGTAPSVLSKATVPHREAQQQLP